MISKREVRLNILSLLQAAPYDVIWDVGAGCGSVAVEVALWSARSQVYAVEVHQKRLEFLAGNRELFGVTNNLHIVAGEAPQALENLPAPNKVFIGGSNGQLKAMLEAVWSYLSKEGECVVSVITEHSLTMLNQFLSEKAVSDIEIVEVSIRKGELHSEKIEYTKKRPVTLVKFKRAVE